MTAPADLEDRLAARLLGVDVDADAAVVRASFRRLARSVHPDTAVDVGCVDLGRLAAAKHRLVSRAEARGAEARGAEARARIREADRARRDAAARERLLRIRRAHAARDRVERLRLAADAAGASVAAGATGATVPRRRSASAGRLGLLVDVVV